MADRVTMSMMGGCICEGKKFMRFIFFPVDEGIFTTVPMPALRIK
jgi:hypothetical protein